MKKDYVVPAIEDLGSLRDETQVQPLFGVRLEGDGLFSGRGGHGGHGGHGSPFS